MVERKGRTSLLSLFKPRRLPLGLLLAPLVMVADAGQALAQLAQADAVMHRPRPEFDPIGLEVFGDPGDPGGDFLLFPEIAITSGYDTNIFRVKENVVSDSFVEIRPRLRLSNEGDFAQFQLIFDGAFRRNLSYSQNDFNDFGGRLLYSRALGEDTQTNLDLAYSRRHDGRSNPNTPQDRELDLVRYNEYKASLSVNQRLGNFVLIPGGQASYTQYMRENGVSNADRDYVLYRVNTQIGYNIEEGLRVFVDPYMDWRRYLQKDVGRDSDGYGMNVGVLYDISAVSFAQFSAGYFTQNYANESLEDASGFNFNLQAIWNPTDQMTVNLTGGTNVEETTVAGASSTTRYSLSGGVDYEVQDNIMITSLIGFSSDLYNGVQRDDQYLQGALGLVYLTNEYMAFRLTYDYDARMSTDQSLGYEDHTIALNLTLQY